MEYIQEDTPKWMYPSVPSGQNATLTARMVSVRLPPKPQFKFVQDNQVSLSVRRVAGHFPRVCVIAMWPGIGPFYWSSGAPAVGSMGGSTM